MPPLSREISYRDFVEIFWRIRKTHPWVWISLRTASSFKRSLDLRVRRPGIEWPKAQNLKKWPKSSKWPTARHGGKMAQRKEKHIWAIFPICCFSAKLFPLSPCGLFSTLYQAARLASVDSLLPVSREIIVLGGADGNSLKSPRITRKNRLLI